ncbi:MAG: PDZ domain-containing protein [Deltaproteobacteria bacterium]|nr:PDZ domain-containing protein [Deltaproteobacteria bacterium]
MQRSAFYAIVGFSIVVAAASLGFSASRFLSLRYFSLPSLAAARGTGGDSGRSPAIPPERWTNIFAPERGMEMPSHLAGSQKTVEALPRTRFVLLGTIASDSPTARRAILWAEGMKAPKMEREQAELEPGVRLVRIERDYVMLARGKEQEKLDLLPVGSRTRIMAPPAPPATGASPSVQPPYAAGEIRVTRLGENSFSVDEATVSQLTGNINQYMTNVRLIPYFEGNKSAGYRIAAIRPGSAFEQLGFRGGDIIQQINNVELSTPDKMFTIFQNLKDEKRVTVNILRQGQKSSITYEIR